MSESSSQVDSDLDIIPPSTSPIKNGKRGAEKVVEPQAVGSKKIKVVNGDVKSIKEEQHRSLLSNQEQQKNKVEVPSSIKSTILQEPEKASSCNEFEQDDRDDNSNKENDPYMGTPLQSVEVPSSMISTETLHEAKKASNCNEFEQDDGDDNSNDQHMGMKSVELPPAIKSTTTQDAERTSISNEHEEEENRDDSSKELYMATERTEHTVTTSRATGLKTLFLGNLSFAIEEDDVRDFFKDAGEIAAIRFVIRDDRFLGYGYIEFATAEAAQEALKLNKEVLLDRKVRLELTMDRGAYTPNNSMEKPYRRGVQAQGRTIFVRGFDSSDGFDNIKSALEKHFGKCGEISRMSIPREYESGVAKGIAFIDFADRNGVRQALRLDGSEVAGSRLTVEEAKRQTGDIREGIGYGLRNWVRGSGSGGSWVRDGGSASGSGRGNGSIGGWGRENASGYASVRESGSVVGLHRESGYGSGLGRESGYGSGPGRESGYGSGPGRESGYGSGPGRESGYGSVPGRESGYGSGPGRESGSGGSWHRDNVSGSSWHRESGYGRGPHREGGAGGSWHRESGSGRGWHGVSSVGRGRGNENSYGRGEGRGSGYGRGGFGSSLGYRGGRSGPIGSGFSSSRVGGGSGWGRGSGYSSGRVGGGVSGYSSSCVGGGSAYSGSRTDRFSGGYGSGRGGGISRP